MKRRRGRHDLVEWGLLVALWAAPWPAGAAAPARVTQRACDICHEAGDAPRLRGLSRSYLTRQVKDFITGQRGESAGGHSCDVAALSRLLPMQLAPLVTYYSEAAPEAGGPPADAESLAVGERLFADGRLESGIQACAACHGHDGGGGTQRGLDSAAVAPRIAGQREPYLRDQLQSFRSGKRHGDFGGIMQRMVADLSDRDDAGLAAYISRMDGGQAPPADLDPAMEMPPMAVYCQACHGQNGESVAETFPKISGLSSSHITKQLGDIQAGRRTVDAMAPIVFALSEEEMKALGAWFSQFEMHEGPYDPLKAQRGERLFLQGNLTTGGYPACMYCHGIDGRGISGVDWAPGDVPRLAGQHPGYIRKAIREFRSGSRSNDHASLMRLVAARMTDREIEDVSHYLYSLGERRVEDGADDAPTTR